jgi:leader peptidase (prepilin peptidase)/N-methyltransferase
MADVAVAVVFGLVIGSFLNVVIARLPEGKSLWSPRSACPGCGTPIAWYDNVPLVSYASLRGRCRGCAMRIPWRYPVVEAVTGLAFGLAYAVLGPTPLFAVAAVLLAMLIAITAIDLRLQIIPDAITLPGIALGVAASLVTGRPGVRVAWLGITAHSWPAVLVDSLLGILIGGGIFLAIILASGGGMGGGDMKLGAMLGAFLGWQLGLLALMLAVLTGGLVAVALLALGRRGRKEAIPFGPFLALGGAVAFLWGDALLGWYLDRFTA